MLQAEQINFFFSQNGLVWKKKSSFWVRIVDILWICLVFNRNYGAQFLHWNQNSKFLVTWPRIAQSVYFLREMCLFFNFWMIKFTIMCFFDIHIWNFYMSKNHNSFKKYTNWAKLSHFWGKCVFWHSEDLSLEISCMNVKNNNIIENSIIKKLKKKTFPSKSIQTEQS